MSRKAVNSRILVVVWMIVFIGAAQRLVAAPGLPDRGLLDGATPALGNTHTAIARGQDGRVYFSGKTGANWQLSRLTANYPLVNQAFNVDFVLDTSFHRAEFSGSPGPDPKGINQIAVVYSGDAIVGGDFTQVDGFNQPYLARVRADGTLDGNFRPEFNGPVRAVVVQPDNKILVGGTFTEVAYTVTSGTISTTTHYPCPGFVRLNADGSLDGAFYSADRLRHHSGPAVHSIALQPDGQILIAGRFTSIWWRDSAQFRDSYARLRPDGSFDSTFVNIDLEPFTVGGAVEVNQILREQTGKIMIVGRFGFVQPGSSVDRFHMVRLFADGNCDVSFRQNITGGRVHTFDVVLPLNEGGYLVGGHFRNSDGTLISQGLFRVFGNGTDDTSFDLDVNTPGFAEGLVLLSDDSVLVAGRIDVNGWSDSRWLTRIFPDDSLDTGTGFVAPSSTPYQVTCSATRPDGRIVVGGRQSSSVGVLTQLRANGEADDSFSLPVALTGGPVHCVAVLEDNLGETGSVIFGGAFSISSPPRQGLAKVTWGDPASFYQFGYDVNGTVHSLAVQSDGKVLIAGRFTATGSGGVTQNDVARLNPDGTLDTSFAPLIHFTAANPMVWDIDLDDTGGVLITGNFDQVNGLPRAGFARLDGGGALDAGFVPNITSNSPSNPAVVGGAVVQGDGGVVVYGDFNQVDGVNRHEICRLLPGGALDTATFVPAVWPLAHVFDPASYFLGPVDVVGMADGQTIASRRWGINVPSVPDPTFVDLVRFDTAGEGSLLNWLEDYGSSLPVYPYYPVTYPVNRTTTIQRNGQIIVGGDIIKLGTESVPYPMARMQNSPAEEFLQVVSRDTIVWSRSGSAPEAQSVKFEHSSDHGMTWTPLGNGVRVPGGWEISGITPALPTRGHVRATARIVSGGNPHGGGSSSGLVRTAATYKLPMFLVFREWMLEHIQSLPFFPPYIMLSLDMDLDGESNMDEFIMGTDPDGSGEGPQGLSFTGTFAGGGSILRHGSPIIRTENTMSGPDHRVLYLRRKDRADAGLTYVPQFSQDLGSWTESDDSGTVISQNASYELVAVRFPSSFGGASKQFFRLAVLTEDSLIGGN
jgi:uncharacterized delta-60 repeat protein